MYIRITNTCLYIRKHNNFMDKEMVRIAVGSKACVCQV